MCNIRCYFIWFLVLFSYSCYAQLPDGFVYAHRNIPDLVVDLRYCGANNFVGGPISGYHNDVVIVTQPTAEALKNVQNSLKPMGLVLKVFDAYRPQQAVDEFVEWAKRIADTVNKQQFYPNVAKKNLFKEGYIAYKSGHSAGSTVDVTLVDVKTGKELDMGTPFDYFGRESWVDYQNITEKQKDNRQLLQRIMLDNGFTNYPQEWWHFTLKNQPFKGKCFDFPVE